MKRNYILILVLLALGVVRGGAGVSRAQDPLVVNSQDPLVVNSQDPLVVNSQDPLVVNSQDPLVVNSQDPLVVNSKSIALKLENPRVRVLEATLEPGARENLHSHPAYVIYVIAGGKIRNHGADGTVNEVEFRTGDAIYRDAVTHWAENIGNTTIRLELVELKQ